MPGFARVLARMFALQAAWNYESLQGIGFAYAAEPALRALDGGAGGDRYRAALARQARFFNAHPYLAGLAVGAAVRAEFEGEPPEKIARLRETLCGPLGSIGDRLFWASWLPSCAAIGLMAYALGAGAWAAALFLVLYNAAHVACRVWGLREGWARGMHVVTALQAPMLRSAAGVAAPLAALLVGAALPVVFGLQMHAAGGRALLTAAAGALLVAATLRFAGARANGVRLAMLVLGLTWAAGQLWS
jgi:PTS system mannose-specific IID component